MRADFYEKLYSKSGNVKSKTDIEHYLKSVGMPVLREEDKATCEGLLSAEEWKDALQTFNYNKTPGNDEIPAEFYKTFWPLFGSLMVKSFNESYEKGELGISPKQAVITLIDEGADRTLLKKKPKKLAPYIITKCRL